MSVMYIFSVRPTLADRVKFHDWIIVFCLFFIQSHLVVNSGSEALSRAEARPSGRPSQCTESLSVSAGD